MPYLLIHYPVKKVSFIFYLSIRPTNFTSFIVGVIYVINTCWPSFNSKSSYRRTLLRTLPLLSTQYVHVGTYCEFQVPTSQSQLLTVRRYLVNCGYMWIRYLNRPTFGRLCDADKSYQANCGRRIEQITTEWVWVSDQTCTLRTD